MTSDRPGIDVEDFLAHLTDRGLGDIPLRSQAALSPFSRAQMDGARNLLTKAVAALDRGDDRRARSLVDRAVRLPYDEFERTHPAAWEAQGMVDTALVDRLESSDGKDWLLAALDVLDQAPHHGRCTLRDCLTDICQDWELPPAQLRTIRTALADVPSRRELRDLDVEPSELATAVLETLETLLAVEDSLP